MFEDFVRKNAMENEIKPSKKRINAERSALRSLIEQENGIMKKTKIKRVVIAIAAACAVMLCGVTAAALGYFDFESLFGNYIRVDNKELADSLLGTVSNVRYKVSDKNYKINVKGAAGDKYNVIAVAELSRVDGTPIAEYLNIPAQQEHLVMLWGDTMAKKPPFGEELAGSTSFGVHINEDGNIEFEIKINGGKESVDGCKIVSLGKNFYPDFATIQKFQRENGVYYGKNNKGKYGWYKIDENGCATDIPAEVDDSAIKLLDLEWEFSFKYNVSDAGLEKKVCEAPEDKFIYYWDIYEMTYETMPDGTRHGTYGDLLLTAENITTVKSIEVEAMHGLIEYEFPMNEYFIAQYEEDADITNSASGKNEIYLIKSDGTKIKATTNSSSLGYGDDGIVKGRVDFSYVDDNYMNILTELDDITSISINGTVYELS